MKLTLTIDIDEDGERAPGIVADLMRDEAERVDAGFTSGYITGPGGAKAGYWELS